MRTRRPRIGTPTNPEEVILKYTERAKSDRLATHLGVSIGLMADADVMGRTYRDPNGAAAYTVAVMATEGRDRSRYNVGFNQTKLGDDLALWLGAAWHELGHVMYSPFEGNIPITLGFNLLEDARVETLTLQSWPKIKPALLAILSHELNKVGATAQDPVFQYAWVAGRTHIDRKIRRNLRKKVEADVADKIDADVADKIDDIYRQYLTLDLSDKANIRVALKLVRRMDDLLGGGKPTCGSGVTGSQDKTVPDEVVSQDNLDELAKNGEDDNEDTGEGSGGADEDSDKEDNDKAGDGDEDSDKAGDGEGDSDKAEDSDKAGMGAGEGDDESPMSASDVVRALRKEAMDSEEFEQERKQLDAYVRKATSIRGKDSGFPVTPPPSQAVRHAREVRRIAASFNDDSAKGLVRHRDSGRLKPYRYERTSDLDTAYDMYEPGLSQEMYVSLIVDVSGSMANAPVSDVVYSLEYGLSEVAEVEVAYFNDWLTLPPTKNTATSYVRVQPNNGTSPKDAVAYAHSKAVVASQMNKLIVFYTDGEFNQPQDYLVTSVYLKDLKDKGANIRILYDTTYMPDPRQLKAACDWLEPHEIVPCQSLDDLPDIVLGWTRDVLTTPIG